MRPAPTPLSRARTLAVGSLGLLLVPGALVAPAVAGPVSAPATEAAEPVVRLARDGATVVRSAEVGLPAGTTRLQTSTYSMVAATWRGTAPRVAVRTAPGAAWQRLPLLEDGPSVGSDEGVPGLRGTDLVWTGPATGIDVRVSGAGHRHLELVLIEPGELASDDAVAPAARATTTRPPRTAPRGPAADPRRLGRQPALAQRPPALPRRAQAGPRPPHRDRQLLQPHGRPRPDPRDVPLPHPVPGLVRHRLQLPGRPVRPRLGGPVGRPAGWSRVPTRSASTRTRSASR